MSAWRGVPVLPCPKIPLTSHGVTSILAMRTGEQDAGVVGLPDVAGDPSDAVSRQRA